MKRIILLENLYVCIIVPVCTFVVDLASNRLELERPLLPTPEYIGKRTRCNIGTLFLHDVEGNLILFVVSDLAPAGDRIFPVRVHGACSEVLERFRLWITWQVRCSHRAEP